MRTSDDRDRSVRVHLELRRKGVTLTLLWQEYRAEYEGQRTWGLTQFCEHYKRYAKTLRRSMRQQHRAGEKLFVDYAGPTLAPTSIQGVCAGATAVTPLGNSPFQLGPIRA